MTVDLKPSALDRIVAVERPWGRFERFEVPRVLRTLKEKPGIRLLSPGMKRASPSRRRRAVALPSLIKTPRVVNHRIGLCPSGT